MRLLTYRDREGLIEHAASFIGTTEHPPGSNRGPQVEAWQERAAAGVTGYPWCAAFVYCMCVDKRVDLEGLTHPAAVLSWVRWAEATGRRKAKPSGGFLVCYSWHGADPHPDDHMGVVEKSLSAPLPFGWTLCRIRTIEGNTLDGRVARQVRWVRRNTVAFIRV